MGYPGIPPVYYIYIYDANGNFITSTNGHIPLARQIPEFPSIALPVAAILGMIAIIGRRKE
ncbi:hypothetical protein DU30_13765 [Methanosarcina mazei]|uniref:PEF-CTERM protein sorting domain-containing protein n=1 Tax=Methanosarcina mazei TaxID=2209 RepID=A0A0F8DTB3_METMZ|nr:hypothetical protein DU30_13765 [Methanosarcina mazei]